MTAKASAGSTGLNPDIELQTALAGAGRAACDRPRPTANGSSPGRSRSRIGVALAQEFFPAMADAWRVALTAAADHADSPRHATPWDAAHARCTATSPAADGRRRGRAGGHHGRRLASPAGHRPQPVDRTAPRSRARTSPPRAHGGRLCSGCTATTISARRWSRLGAAGLRGRAHAPHRDRAPDLALPRRRGHVRSFDYVAGSPRFGASRCPGMPRRVGGCGAKKGVPPRVPGRARGSRPRAHSTRRTTRPSTKRSTKPDSPAWLAARGCHATRRPLSATRHP